MKKVASRAKKEFTRYKKQFYQLTHPPQHKTPVFLVGCQRSGTNMLMSVLDKSNQTWIYNEDHPQAFDNYRLRPTAEITPLIAKTNAELVIFKPLNDSQWIDQWLNQYPESKAIWLYRHYKDVAESAVRKWGDHQKDVIRRLAVGDMDAATWRGERIEPTALTLVKELYSPQLSNFEGGLLMWYLRNRIFFDLDLQNQAQTALVNYEDLVLRSQTIVPKLFGWLGVAFQPDYVAHVHATSVNKPVVEANGDVGKLCQDLWEQLEALNKW